MTGVLHTARISTVKVSVSVVNDAREVMGSIPVGDSDFSLFQARVMLISSNFTFHYRV